VLEYSFLNQFKSIPMDVNPEDAKQLISLGVGGLIAWLVIREMFSYLKTRKEASVVGETQQMQHWHQSRDIERAIMQLVEVAKQQSALLTQILHGQDLMRTQITRISTKDDSDHLV